MRENMRKNLAAYGCQPETCETHMSYQHFASPLSCQQPVFYRNPYALRFELGDPALTWRSPLYLPQAFARAQAVFAAAFAGSTHIDILAVRFSFARQRIGKRSLLFRAVDKRCHAGAEYGRSRGQGEYGRRCFHDCSVVFRCLPLGCVDTDMLLRAALHNDFPQLRPYSQVRFYFYEPQRQLLFYLYDDRGLDIAAVHPETLRPLYRRFNDWLLDYDRAQMDNLFASCG